MNIYNWIVLVFLILASFLFISVFEKQDLIVSPDSVSYLVGAESIYKMESYQDYNNDFQNHWPPGYSLFLTIIRSLTGENLVHYLKYVNALLIVMYGAFFYKILRLLKIKFLIAFPLLIVLLFSKPTLIFSYIHSESIFIVLFLISLLYFQKWQTKKRKVDLILLGFLCGLFFLVRYAGAGLIIGFNLCVVLVSKRFNDKILSLLYFNLAASVLPLLWIIYTYHKSIESVNRNIVAHIINFDKLHIGIKVLMSWFTANNLIALLIFSLITILIVSCIVTSRRIKFGLNIKLLAIVSLAYLSFLIFSISFIDAQTSLNNRMLFPLFPLILIMVGIILSKNLNERRNVRVIYAIITLMLIQAPQTSFEKWLEYYNKGGGFNGNEISSSETYQAFKKIEPSIIYSNIPKLFIFRGHKPELGVKEIPNHTIKRDRIKNLNYREDIETLKNDIEFRNAAVVYFRSFPRWFQTQEVEMVKKFDRYNIQIFNDGIIISNFK